MSAASKAANLVHYRTVEVACKAKVNLFRGNPMTKHVCVFPQMESWCQ
jgi:hypothetical protein